MKDTTNLTGKSTKECSSSAETQERNKCNNKNFELAAAAFLPYASSFSFLPSWQSFQPPLTTAATAVGITSGCISFGSTLALSTFLQKHVLRISTGTLPRLIPSTVGFLSVSVACWIGHKAAIAGEDLCVGYYRRRRDPVNGSISSVLSYAYNDFKASAPQVMDHVYYAISDWRDGTFPAPYWEQKALSLSSQKPDRRGSNQDRITLPNIFGNDSPITLPVTMPQLKM